MTTKGIGLERVRTSVAQNHGGTGRPGVYYRAPCGCLFRPWTFLHKGIWHPCKQHDLKEVTP